MSSTNPNVIAKVISFGSVSDELSDKKKLGQKLKSKGFHDNKIQTILAHYTKPMLVSEKSLYNDIVGKLKRNIHLLTLLLLLNYSYHGYVFRLKNKFLSLE